MAKASSSPLVLSSGPPSAGSGSPAAAIEGASSPARLRNPARDRLGGTRVDLDHTVEVSCWCCSTVNVNVFRSPPIASLSPWPEPRNCAGACWSRLPRDLCRQAGPCDVRPHRNSRRAEPCAGGRAPVAFAAGALQFGGRTLCVAALQFEQLACVGWAGC